MASAPKQIIEFTAAGATQSSDVLLIQQGPLDTPLARITIQELLDTAHTLLTVSGVGAVGGNFAVATNKFTVAAATGNTAVAGTLGVTGATTLKQTNVAVGAYTLTGNYSAAASPWSNSLILNSPSDLSTAPTASPRDLTQRLIASDTSVVYKDSSRTVYGNLTTFRDLHQLGVTSGDVSASWGGSRVMTKRTQVTRNSPRESLDPTGSPATFPSVINSWTEQTCGHTFGGTAPLSGFAKGRWNPTYIKTFLVGSTGGSNYNSNAQIECEFVQTGEGSTRRFTGCRMSVLELEGAAPPEGFIAYTGTRSGTSPGWATMFAQGIDQRSGVDPYIGDFVRAGASFAERTPRMRRGLDIADITFGKDAIRWLGGDISGGERNSNDTGRVRVGAMYLRGDSDGGVIDVSGYVGQPFAYTFTDSELSGALNVHFGFTAPLLEDDDGGLYRGILTSDGLNLDSVVTLIPPMKDGSGGAPATTVTLRVRDEFGSAIRFKVTATATTTSIPTDLSVTIEDFFSDYGPWELTFLTGAATGETRAVTAYDATTHTLTTDAFSTVPTATLGLVTNAGFNSAFPVTADTIQNGWQWTVGGGTGSVTATAGVCTLLGGTSPADLDQAITVTDGTVYYVLITHIGDLMLKVGTTRGDTDLLDAFVPYTDPDGAYQSSEVPFTSIGTAAHLRFENDTTSPVLLDFAQCAASADALTNGIQAVLRYPPVTIEQTWTPRSRLSLNPTGGIINVAGLPTSASGLSVGDLYIDSGTVKAVTA